MIALNKETVQRYGMKNGREGVYGIHTETKRKKNLLNAKPNLIHF